MDSFYERIGLSTKQWALFNKKDWTLQHMKSLEQKTGHSTKMIPCNKKGLKQRTLQQQRADSLQTKSSFFFKWSLFKKKKGFSNTNGLFRKRCFNTKSGFSSAKKDSLPKKGF